MTVSAVELTSTSAFAPCLCVPLAYSFSRPHASKPGVIRRRRPQLKSTKLTAQLPQPSTPPAPYPAFIPSIASAIESPAAQAMLRRLEYTPITTTLPQPVIFTSHCTSASPSPSVSPLLFLHGFDSNLLEYRHILPLLDALPCFSAHFIDLLGWGLTEKPVIPGFSYGPAAKREHLRAFHEQVLGGRPVILVGASVGGAAAVDFALEYPERVKGLVLLDPQVRVDKAASAMMRRLPVVAGWGADVLRSRWLRWQAVRLSYESEALKCEDTLRIGGLHCETQGWREAAVDFIVGEGYCVSGRLGEVRAATVVMWGERDRVLGKGDAEWLEGRIGAGKVVVVEGCGHSPHIEKAEEVVGEIRKFVKEVG